MNVTWDDVRRSLLVMLLAFFIMIVGVSIVNGICNYIEDDYSIDVDLDKVKAISNSNNIEKDIYTPYHYKAASHWLSYYGIDIPQDDLVARIVDIHKQPDYLYGVLQQVMKDQSDKSLICLKGRSLNELPKDSLIVLDDRCVILESYGRIFSNAWDPMTDDVQKLDTEVFKYLYEQMGSTAYIIIPLNYDLAS